MLASTGPHRPASSEVRLPELVMSVIEELAPLAQQQDVELGVTAFDAQIVLTAPPYLLHELLILKEVCDALHANISLRTPDNGIGLQVDLLFPAHR